MEIITVSSRGQVVIPERIRKNQKMKKGTKLLLVEDGDRIILEKEEAIRKILKKKKAEEENGWIMLAQESFKEVWDNEKDERAWEKYLDD